MASVQEDTRTTRDGETYKDIDALGWVPADKQQKKAVARPIKSKLAGALPRRNREDCGLEGSFFPLFMIIMEKEI